MSHPKPVPAPQLSRSQSDHLADCSQRAAALSPWELLHAAQMHLERTRAAHAQNRLVNVRMAAGIVHVLETLLRDWDSLTADHAFWLRGAMHYFSTSLDDEPDFQSPLGFEDDAEILNACLRFAGRSDLCLNAEDFDDV